MDFTAIGKMAMELGVIPTLALYLIVSLHRQNKRLTDMVEKREQNNMEMLKVFVTEIVELRKGGQ
jgi:F0F1-type ATP synthase membrane subunit a